MKRFLFPAILIAVLSSNSGLLAECPEFFSGIQSGTAESSMLTEISGIAASRKNSGVLWVHNDTDIEARVYALNVDGSLLGTFLLNDANLYDWEDMAIGPGPEENKDYLYVGDIGDNYNVRPYITIYRIEEPNVDSGQGIFEMSGEAESIMLAYPDGPRDAETLLLDPVTRDLYIISKFDNNSRIYLVRYPQSIDDITIMEYKGQLPWKWATGGDVSAGGNLVIMRGYLNASVWRRTAGIELWEAFGGVECTVPLIFDLHQGEAICFDENGCGYYTVSEGSSRPIYYFGRDGECPLEGDLNGDGSVSILDAGIFACRWLDEDCGTNNFWCDKCDLNKSREVDFLDFDYFAEDWGKNE